MHENAVMSHHQSLRLGPIREQSRRASASVVLCGVVLASGLAMLGASIDGSSRSASKKVSEQRPLLAAVGSAPTFCKDQTWPDIDPRCVKRVDPNAVAVSTQPETARPTSEERDHAVINDQTPLNPSVPTLAALPPSSPGPAPVTIAADNVPAEISEGPDVTTGVRSPERRVHRSRSFGGRVRDRHAVY